MTTSAPPPTEAPSPTRVGLLFASLALVFLTAGSSDVGVWTPGELAVLQRARVGLGDPIRDLARHPWLPDALRTAAYGAWGSVFGLRMVHAAAAAALAGIAAGLGAASGRWSHGAVAGAIALSMPTVAVAGRTALGQPVPELLMVIAALALGWAWGDRSSRRSRRARRSSTAMAVLALGLGVAASGLWLGAGLPLAIAAALVPRGRARGVLGFTAAACLGIAAGLAWTQGDGYIPLLGPAPHDALVDAPEHRRFAAVVEEIGARTFPWLGLAVLGVALGRARVWGSWLALAAGLGGAWALRYGPAALPITVPVAVACVAALERLRQGSARERRVVLVVAFASVALLAKDAAADPLGVLLSIHDLSPFELPAHADDDGVAQRWLPRLGWLAFCGVGVTAWAGRRIASPTGALAGVLAAAMGIAAIEAHVLVPHIGQRLSLATPLDRVRGWTRVGAIEEPLGAYEIRDPALAVVAEDLAVERLPDFASLARFVLEGERRVALVNRRTLGALHYEARRKGMPLYVLDDGHLEVRVVGTTLPPGAEDRSPIPAMVRDAPPALAHPTRVRFADALELVGWELDGPLVRGRKATLTLAFRVLRPLPAGTQLLARFLQGRLSGFLREPIPLGGELYPPHYWRRGDVIVQDVEVEVPALEAMPGTYDLVVALRREHGRNVKITVPAREPTERADLREADAEARAYGVRIRDRAGEVATIGEARVW